MSLSLTQEGFNIYVINQRTTRALTVHGQQLCFDIAGNSPAKGAYAGGHYRYEPNELTPIAV